MQSPSVIDAHVENIRRNGYSIVENALEPDLVEALVDDLARVERERHVKPFSGLLGSDRGNIVTFQGNRCRTGPEILLSSRVRLQKVVPEAPQHLVPRARGRGADRHGDVWAVREGLAR